MATIKIGDLLDLSSPLAASTSPGDVPPQSAGTVHHRPPNFSQKEAGHHCRERRRDKVAIKVEKEAAEDKCPNVVVRNGVVCTPYRAAAKREVLMDVEQGMRRGERGGRGDGGGDGGTAATSRIGGWTKRDEGSRVHGGRIQAAGNYCTIVYYTERGIALLVVAWKPEGHAWLCYWKVLLHATLHPALYAYNCVKFKCWLRLSSMCVD